MKKSMVPRGVFFREFGRYRKRQGYKSLFERELQVEPVQHIVAVENLPLKDFKEILRMLEYRTWALLAGRRGENARAVKDSCALLLGILKRHRRHLKTWDMTAHSCFLFTTAHNEDAPANLVIHPIKTLRYHLSKGKGDYESGTRDFFEELDNIIS